MENTVLVTEPWLVFDVRIILQGCAYALEWGHGQYPVLWTSWALAADVIAGTGDGELGVAVARAAAVYLYVCAGLTKLVVPVSATDYLRPATMRVRRPRRSVITCIAPPPLRGRPVVFFGCPGATAASVPER